MVHAPQKISLCDLEIVASWRDIRSATPDIVEIASGCEKNIVCSVSPDGQDVVGRADDMATEAEHSLMKDSGTDDSARLSVCNRMLRETAAAAKHGAVAPLKILTMEVIGIPKDGSDRAQNPSQDPIILLACDLRWTREAEGRIGPEKLVFVNAGPSTIPTAPAGCGDIPGAKVVACAGEKELLRAWHKWVIDTDPDIIAVFQV